MMNAPVNHVFALVFLLCVPHFAMNLAESESVICRTGEEHGHTQMIYNGRCCDSCPPGFYMTRPCKVGQPDSTKCGRCSFDTYTAGRNLRHNCIPQPRCNPKREQIKRPGSIANVETCECKDGYYKSASDLCLPWTKCDVGWGVIQQGNSTHNVVCEKCPVGTFSDQESMVRACFQHTSCEENGLNTLKTGSDRADAVCSTSPKPRDEPNATGNGGVSNGTAKRNKDKGNIDLEESGSNNNQPIHELIIICVSVALIGTITT
ncbi:tumor necrosis factor receptor superfamily member 5-like [Glandiceps talaboti]